ncbi:MAG: T9SS type A sorting domain-containing protein [Candidatus Cloacimonetes bacterium]|nr:T9SS type A sorting domain-containing protein [Candidatus Cloacimonadota bacterium]
MKRFSLIILLLILVIALLASQGTIRLDSAYNGVRLVRNTQDGITLKYSVDALHYKQIETSEGIFTEINIADYTTTNVDGMPRLPLLRQLISVPLAAEMNTQVTAQRNTHMTLSSYGLHYPLVPKQPSVSKSADPAQAQFVINRDFYNLNKWTSDPLIRVEEIGMMRGVRLFAVDFAPLRYNPSSGEIEVVMEAEVEIAFIGADHDATQELYAKTWSPAFESVVASTVINHHQPRMTLNRYPLGYVIVTPQMFVDTLQPFIQWKRREGFNVIVATTEQIGNTTNQIKTYLQGLWDNATPNNPAPSYLLIVGDTAQVPAWQGVTDTGHITDLSYVRLQGTDYIPEMYYGRFSATNVNELIPQVEKSLMHEQFTMPDTSYLANSVLIAGVDSYWAPTHANGQINYGVNNYFNATQGINPIAYMYPQSASQAGAIVNSVSQGAGYVNYTAHGSTTSWSDPAFTISNINNLQNANKYPVVVGNCCVTSSFNVGLCFGEAWLRAPNKGGVIYIGGTNNTYWDEDYWWAVGYKPPVVGAGSPFVANRTGVYDALFHTHEEPYDQWAPTTGAMVVMGNLAVATSNSVRMNYYWEIYCIMGDPSLVPYLGIPAENAGLYPDQIFIGESTADIIAEPYTHVALSMNNELRGTALVGANGNVTLNFTPFDQPGTAQLVMTRSRRRPLIANIDVLPNVGPYVMVQSINVNDGNNNVPEAGETINLDVTFNNVGIQNATNLTATISTQCPYVTITNSTTSFAEINSGSTLNVPSAFTIMISPMIPDQTQIQFDFSITDGNNVWSSQRSVTVNAPNVAFGNVLLVDQNTNGIFESGETIQITVNITNTGSMVSESGTLNVVMNYPNATLSQDSFIIPNIPVGINIPVSFSVMLGMGLPNGVTVPIGIALTAGVQMANHSILIPIGQVSEGFEAGNFSAFPWQNNSPIPWTVVSGTGFVNSGTYAARSGTVSHNGNTELSITLNISAAGSISFWRRVSSEAGYDFLKFYIDTVEVGGWSGNQTWAQFTYPVVAGTRTFKWVYSKDGSLNSGSDCAWIDDIIFPASGAGNVPIFFTNTGSLSFENVPYNTTVSANFSIRNLGSVNMNGSITIPAGFVLLQNGNILPSTYNYTVNGVSTALFTLSYTTTNVPVTFNGDLIITSNDPYNNVHSIPVFLQTSVSNDDPSVVPVVTRLDANYPNPFNPETTISFGIRHSGAVRINVYNIKGQLVRTLVDANLNAGNHRVVWSGTDNSGRIVSSGVYLYRMETAGYTKTQKMMLLK